MRDRIKKVHITAMISAVYFAVVWITYFYISVSTSIMLNLLLLLLMTGCSYPLIKMTTKKIRQIEIYNCREITLKNRLLVSSLSTLFVFSILMIWILAYYPGSFSPDSLKQYNQAITGVYSDWHPVWHTIIFFKIPLLLFGNPASMIVMQIIYFAIIMGYLSLTVYELSSLRGSVLTILYIMLNPYTGFILLYPWKDVAFAMGGLLSSIMVIRLLRKKDMQMRNVELLVFPWVWTSTTLFRHNAIFFTGPLLLLFMIGLRNKKKNLYVLISSIVLLVVIRGGLYAYLDVEKPDERVIEAMGLPLTVIGNVAKETPQLMDEELAEFAYSIATPEQWQGGYYCGSFNTIKWSGVNLEPVEEKGYIGMIRLMNKCFARSPRASFQAFFELTDIVYGFETGLEGDVGAGISQNDYGIAYPEERSALSQKMQADCVAWSDFVNHTVFRYLRTYGVCIFLLILVYLSKLEIKDKSSVKKSLMILPLLAYDFGTMLLLTGADSRFFYITFVMTPLLIVYSLHREENENAKKVEDTF